MNDLYTHNDYLEQRETDIQYTDHALSRVVTMIFWLFVWNVLLTISLAAVVYHLVTR